MCGMVDEGQRAIKKTTVLDVFHCALLVKVERKGMNTLYVL